VNDRRGIDVRAMRPDELDATLEVWRAASVARGRPGTGPRLAIARSMMQARGGITYVAVDPAIAGMARVETIGAIVRGSQWSSCTHRGSATAVAERFYSSLRMKRTGARAAGARSEQMEFSLSLSVPGGTSLQAIAGSTRSTAARAARDDSRSRSAGSPPTGAS
jgi:hypothetical protein